MKTTTLNTRMSKMMTRFDNELKSLLMNDLRGKRLHKTSALKNMQVSGMPAMKIA
ncbi:MAG: hypothetical protein INR69_16050 [Mucilaginibacter polytrichastri]|nr:hypothetical protein [Mucilaginibacter polytrichastri]